MKGFDGFSLLPFILYDIMFLFSGLQAVQQAVAADHNGDYPAAVFHYERCLPLFSQALSIERDPQRKQLIEQKYSEYHNRLQTIKASQQPQQTQQFQQFQQPQSFQTPTTSQNSLSSPSVSSPIVPSPRQSSVHPMVADYASRHPPDAKGLQAALDLAEHAQREDKSQNFQGALDLYIDVLDRLSIVLKGSTLTAQMNKSIRETMLSYLERAEKIKSTYNITPNLRPPPGSPSPVPSPTHSQQQGYPAPQLPQQQGYPSPQLPQQHSFMASGGIPQQGSFINSPGGVPQQQSFIGGPGMQHQGSFMGPAPSQQQIMTPTPFGPAPVASQPSVEAYPGQFDIQNQINQLAGLSINNGGVNAGSPSHQPSPFDLPSVGSGGPEEQGGSSSSTPIANKNPPHPNEMLQSDKRAEIHVCAGPGTSGGNGKDKGGEEILVQNTTKSHVGRKPLMLKAKLMNNAVHPGDKVRIYVEVHNRSTMVVRNLKVTMRRHTRNLKQDEKGKSSLRAEKHDVRSNEYWQGAVFPLPAEADYKGHIEFDIPVDVVLTNLEHRGYFEREYDLKLECVLSLHNNLAVYIPVIVEARTDS